MKHAALWIAVALVAAVLLLLADPFGWSTGDPSPTVAPTGAAARAGDCSADPALAQVEGEVQATQVKPPSAEEPASRRTVDPAAANGRAVFRLLDSAGGPVRAARVLIARDGELLLDTLVDDRGEVAVRADGEEAQLVARADPHALASWPVRLDLGTHELLLAERARVAGRIERKDGTPAAGIDLRLDSERPLVPAEPLPAVAWGVLRIDPRVGASPQATSGPDGSFEFDGLPETWAGRLAFPESRWRVLSSNHGVPDTYSLGLRLEAPVADLLVRLAPIPALRGRLLSRASGAPMPGAALIAMVRSPDLDGPRFSSDVTDEEGRFELLLIESAQVRSLDLRLGGDYSEGLRLLALDGALMPSDRDLGDVLVDDAHDVGFLLHTAQGEPIQGGTANAGDAISEPTDEEGRGVLRWLPATVERMRIQAVGFVPVEVDLPPRPCEALDIVLSPANRLEVHLLAPEGGNPRRFTVVLRNEGGVTAGPVRDTAEQRAYVEDWGFPPRELMRAPAASYLTARPSAEGLAVFRALRAGTALELEVCGSGLSSTVYHRRTLGPLGAEEVRRIEVALGDDLVVFRGHVLDARGEPLAGATVRFGDQTLARSEEDGGFLGFLVDPHPATLLVQHVACAPLILPDYAVPLDGRDVEFRLQPARTLTIEVVDEAGRPVPQAKVLTEQAGMFSQAQPVEDARFVDRSLADGPFRIVVSLGGRTYPQEHDAFVSEARVVVPVPGSVVASVPEATTARRAGTFLLRIAPVEGQPGEPFDEWRGSVAGLRIEVPAVAPGRYLASLRYVPTDAERAAGNSAEGSTPVEVTVEPGRTTEIVLDLD